jgi:predicted TPR repeat methyltransferase
MNDRDQAGQEIEAFFEKLWQQGDYWKFESSAYEIGRYAHLMRQLEDRRYPRAMEIGCGAGHFTRQLATLSDRIRAFDVAPSAISRARSLGADLKTVDFEVANVMDKAWDPGGPWDLIVFNDTIHYLGWKYPFFDVAWLATQLHEATAAGGRLLMANVMYSGDYLLLPQLVYTDRDLFLNVGFRKEKESTFRGTKDGVEFELLVSLFAR